MKEKIKPTEAEMDILKILWDKGPSTVKEINTIQNEVKEVGYTTTLKIMQIMLDKGLLTRKSQGRGHIYKPLIKQSDTQKSMLNQLVNSAFGGSASKLVMQALGNHKASKEELDEIRSLIDKIEGKKK